MLSDASEAVPRQVTSFRGMNAKMVDIAAGIEINPQSNGQIFKIDRQVSPGESGE
jgi:hypothetical protein